MGEPWLPVSHANLAEILAVGLRQGLATSELKTFGERYRMAAFLLDLSCGVVGSMTRTLALTEDWRTARELACTPAKATAAAARDDILLALEIRSRLKNDIVFHTTLEAVSEFRAA